MNMFGPAPVRTGGMVSAGDGRADRAGFTLTDLLVVIVVILLVAGLPLTARSNAKSKARRLSCADNLRQLVGVAALCDRLAAVSRRPLGGLQRSLLRVAYASLERRRSAAHRVFVPGGGYQFLVGHEL